MSIKHRSIASERLEQAYKNAKQAEVSVQIIMSLYINGLDIFFMKIFVFS